MQEGLSDAELMALCTLQLTFLVGAQGENDMRKCAGEAPAYRDGGCYTDESTKINKELVRREAARERRKCPTCNGVGWPGGYGVSPCPECLGNGRRRPIPTPAPQRRPHE